MVDADTLDDNPRGWTSDHVMLHSKTVETLLCDCVIHRVTRAGSTVLDFGHATYSVPKNLFRAVAARDGGCRVPGCDRPVSWCDCHHLIYWEHLGPTAIHNLGLFCNRHHHWMHRHNIIVKLLPNADMARGRVARSARRRSRRPRRRHRLHPDRPGRRLHPHRAAPTELRCVGRRLQSAGRWSSAQLRA